MNAFFSKINGFFHSRFFNFVLLPLLVGVIYCLTTGVDDLKLRLMIIAQMFFVNMVAFFLAKAITAGVSSEAAHKEAMSGNVAAGVVYFAILLVRVVVYYTMIYGYTSLLNGKVG
jgi:hypothetical protein